MKRILSVILSVSLIVSLFACNAFSVFAADQEVQATETTENVVVSHYTGTSTMGTAAGIQSLKDDGDITVGSQLINGNLDNKSYKFTSYVGSTPTEIGTPYLQLKPLANSPFSTNDLNAPSLKRQTGTKTANGTDCIAYAEGRDSKGYYQIYSYGDTSANSGYGDKFEIEYLDIENTDANARAKAVVQYDLGDGWNVSDLVLGWGNPQYRAGYYVVLTSANGKDFTEQYRYTADKIGDSNITNSNVQHIKLKNPVYARYVQIVFYSAVNSVASSSFRDMIVNNSSIRVRTIQIFGVREFTFDDHGTYSNSTDQNYTIPAATVDTYNDEVIGTKTASLIAGLTPVASNYFVSSASAVGTSFDNGDGTLKSAYTYDAKTPFALESKYAKRFTDGDLFSSDLVLTDDAAIRRMFINLNMATNDSTQVLKTHLIDDESKQWIQLDYDLGFSAEVSQFALVGKVKPRFNASHYKYYVSDTLEGLYDEANCVAEVGTAAAIGSVTLQTPKKGRYVAIRFICVHNTELHTGLGLASLYSRATEFAVFGSHANVPDANVEIATEEGVPSSLIQKGEPVYTGKTDSYGKYGAGTVALTAIDYYEDIANKKSYTFAGWYNGEEPVSVKPEYTYDLTGDDITLTAKYDVKETTVKYTLTFVDASKIVVGTVVVEEGKTVDMALVNAIEVKDIYGYDVLKDEDGNVVWDRGFDEAITADATYTARYKANEELKTTVTVYDVDGSKYIDNREVRFDSQINLVSTKGAEYWADAAGNVLVGAPTGKLYACGTTMEIYAKTGEFKTPAVAFVGKEMKDGKFTVFAHAAPTAKVKAYGIIFASNTYKLNYDAQGENTGDMFTLKDTAAINKVNPSLKVSEVNVTTEGLVDFMATLNGCGGKVRHARAYVVYGDDTVVYSDVIVTNNQEVRQYEKIYSTRSKSSKRTFKRLL